MSDEVTIPYETKFEDGSEITSYLAIGVAEGFETKNGNTDTIRAWSYICGKRLYIGLQGWFGRNIHSMIEAGMFDVNGKVNWDVIEERINT